MDPRLHPKLTPRPAPLMHDVLPGTPVAQPPVDQQPNPSAPKKPMTSASPNQIPEVVPRPTTELVESIPVHQPTQPMASQAPAAPIVQMPGYNPATQEPEDDLDKILQAVNNRVNAPMSPAAKPKKQILNKVVAKASKAKQAAKTSKPIAAMGVVVLVALALSTVAVMAYRQGSLKTTLAKQPGKVGTSYTAGAAIQSAGGTLVRPGDLDDYSQTLQNKLNGLNDSQDFDANSLSDSVLGL